MSMLTTVLLVVIALCVLRVTWKAWKDTFGKDNFAIQPKRRSHKPALWR